MRLHAHFGMLPIGAFEHCGDKRIKPQGGGGFIGDIVDTVGDVVSGVGDVVGDVVEAVGDAGSWIDDKVNEEIPGGWYTVGAVTGATMGLPTDLGLSEAATAGATEAGSGFGLNPASTGGFGLGTSTAGTGINASSLGGIEWLSGAGSLPIGTAGLTAEQISNAALAGSIGSNASSGLGYLGGASSLPAGTAGITGVGGSSLLSNLSGLGQGVGQGLSNGNTSNLLSKGLIGGSNERMQIGHNMNQSPFTFTAQQSIQGGNTTSTVPQELQQQNQLKELANLLRK